MKYNYNAMKKIANMTVEMIFEAMPESKKEVFRNACARNDILTTTYGLMFSTLTVYKEGFYIEMNGTRSRFAAFARDYDGELVIERKPKADKLNELWSFHWLNEMPIDQYAI